MATKFKTFTDDEVDSVTDIAVFATEGEAADFAAKLTKVADDGCFAEKPSDKGECLA